MKKSVLAALVLGASLSVTGCFDKESKAGQEVEKAKASVVETKEAVVNAANEVKNSAVEAAKEAKETVATKVEEVKETTA
ncbi:hypothetical protein I138_06513, partial [Pasteurella multocida 1500E]